MTPQWEPSAFKHNITQADQIYAILNPNFRYVIDTDTGNGRVLLVIGHPHEHTDREIEILIREFPNSQRQAHIFHAMPLSSRYRKYREEHPDGWC